MASEGAQIRIDVDPSKAVTGIEDVTDALDKINDNLDDVGKEGSRDVDKLEKSIKDLNQEALKTGSEFERSVGKGIKKSTDEAGEGLNELKDESRSTAKEAAASFDGSAESIIDAFQEVAANAFAGFGAAGLVAGAVVAAGIGTATAAFQANEEAAQAAKQRVRDFGISIIESGDTAAALEYINNNIKLIVTNADDAPKKFDDLRKMAEKTGLSVGALGQAYAGNTDAIDDMLKAAKNAYDEEIASLREARDENASANDGYSEKSMYLEQIQEELKRTQEETAAAAQIEKNYLATGGAEALAKEEAINNINDAYDEAVFGVENFKNAETGIYDLEAYAASIKEREALLEQYQTNLANSGLTTEQKAALNEMGVEQANAILQGLQDPAVSQETKDTMKRGLQTAASESSGLAKKEIETAFKSPIQATVKATADTTDAEKQIKALTQISPLKIPVTLVTKEGKEVG